MSTAQHRVSDYLQCELFHVIGAYRITEERLKDLERRLDKFEQEQPDDAPPDELLRLTRLVQSYNGELARERHSARGRGRHPIPSELPLSVSDRFDSPPKMHQAIESPWRSPEAWSWVVKFYESAIHVLSPDRARGDLTELERAFSDCLTCPRDGLRSPTKQAREARRRRRHDRFDQRLKQALECLPGAAEDFSKSVGEDMLGRDNYLRRIASANLSTGAGSLPLFVLAAQAEAHLSMHGVEGLLSLPLGEHARLAAQQAVWLNGELQRCISLATFAYSVSRSAPWIFAEDESESRTVFENLTDAWQNVVPTRCMWVGAQVSLLALHRRAYARALLQGEQANRTAAYNDYHKLQQLIRDTERRVKAAPIHVDGALDFLAALDAQAHHHIGELYRAEYAQTSALRHFDAGEDRLKVQRERGTMDEVLTDSRWLVQLHVSRGKSSYELGRHKDTLRSYLRAWRAFLQLLAANTGTEPSTEDIDRAITWLGEVRHEPELRKPEVYEYVRPIVEQLAGVTVDYRLGALAAEILLRLGHLLFVLNVGQDLKAKDVKAIINARTGSRNSNPEALWPYQRHDAAIAYVIGRLRNGLAALCLQKAAECDEHSTLVGADLAKIRLRIKERGGSALPKTVERRLTPPELAPVRNQWPLGDDYEQIARVVEYLLLRALVERSSEERADSRGDEYDDERIAAGLLLAFFTHTDSINVRKSQTHRFLTQLKNPDPQPKYDDPTIEFVCMRRYSSAFPLLPRPSAFHAHAGGYFVRLHSDEESFGVVIDPGTDFVENLYRTGYSLSDIDLIVVTHDHVDHVGALDGLLSLLYERAKMLRKERGKDPAPVRVLANASVRSRYAYAKRIGGKAFLSLEALEDEGMSSELLPTGFKLSAISSAVPDGSSGHLDLGVNPSLGVCFSTTSGDASIAFTSDVPPPPSRDEPRARRAWEEHWQAALCADVLVVHLSTVPLTELRKLAKLNAVNERPRASEVDSIDGRVTGLLVNARALQCDSDDAPLLHGELARATAGLIAQLVALKRKSLRRLSHAEVDAAANALAVSAEGLLKALALARGVAPSQVSHIDALARAARILGADARLHVDSEDLLEARRSLEAADGRLRGRLEFAYWLRSSDNEDEIAGLLDPVEDWSPPPEHPYLKGFLDWARAYRSAREQQGCGMFVVGELSEELGTARSKVAERLNRLLFRSRNSDGVTQTPKLPEIHTLTADVGLRVLVTPREERREQVEVLCSTCSLDMDRVRTERFHRPRDIREVCVKGENEGIFYNCEQHDPSQQAYPAFLEQLEAFDIFGR